MATTGAASSRSQYWFSVIRRRPTEDAKMRRAIWALSAVGCVLVAMGLPLSAAAAAREKVGEIPGVSPSALAIDAHDDVWVGEPAKGAVSEYAPYPSTDKIGEIGGRPNPTGLAVDDATGLLYVDESGTVYVYDPASAHPSEPLEHWSAPGSKIAIDNSGGPSSGQIWVLGGGIVYAFEPNGEPAELEEIGNGNEIARTKYSLFGEDGYGSADGLAVDSQGDIYVADSDISENLFGEKFSGEAVWEFRPGGAEAREFGCPESGLCGGSLGYRPVGVAVDPSTGDLLALSGPAYEFSPQAESLGHFSGAGFPLAFNSEGYLYAAAGEDLDIFANLPFKLTYQPLTDLTASSATLNATVDPQKAEGGANVTKCEFEYGLKFDEYALGKFPCLDAEGNPVGTEGHPIESSTKVHAGLSNLSAESTYHYRLVASDGTEPLDTRYGADQPYTPHYVYQLQTEVATELSPNDATLNASFLGNGEDTHYYFEYAPAHEYRTTHRFSDLAPEPPANAGPVEAGKTENLSVKLAEKLEPNTRYLYRIVAENAAGLSHGEVRHLTTTHSQPLVKESVVEVHSDSARLTARINPGGAETTYHFEYGTGVCSETPDPCTPEPVPDVDIGSGQGTHSVSLLVSGLTPGTLYHYRVVATNEKSPPGGTDGAEQTFTTYPFGFTEHCPNEHVRQQTGAALLLDCRAYELVSAPNTDGFDVESNLVEGQTPFPGYPEASGASGTSRLLYAVHDGGIPGTGHPTNRGLDPYLATRGKEGWSTEYVGIPADGTPSIAPFGSTLLEADSGLDTFAFGGSEICSPCFNPPLTETGEPLHLPSGELVQGMAGSIPQPTAKPAGYIAKDLSANGEHFVFGSTSRFEPEGNDNGEISIYDRNLRTEETHVVSDEAAGNPILCTLDCASDGIGELDISSNGSRILLGQLAKVEGGAKYWHLYMNVGDSAAIELAPTATEGVVYDGMTTDGSRVFFSSAQHLTGEDTEHSGTDIYEAEVSAASSTLHLVSKGNNPGLPGEPGNTASCDPASNTRYVHWNTTGTRESCAVVAVGGQGGVASADGTVYFLSPELLDGPAHGTQGAPNLYLARPGSAPRFVATLESTANAALPPSEHPFLRSFGSFAGGEVEKVLGIAVDYSDGDTYALETQSEQGVLEKFDPSGNLDPAFGTEGKFGGATCPDRQPFTETQEVGGGIAVDNSPGPSHGDVYVPDLLNGFVDKIEPSGKCTASIPVRHPAAVAVDPVNGDLYVAAGFSTSTITVYSPSGEQITAFPTIKAPNSLAVDSHGIVYAANTNLLNFMGEAAAYNSSGALIGTFAPEASAVAVDTAASPVTNPDYDHVYADEGGRITEFAPASGTQLGAQIGGPTAAGLLHSSQLSWAPFGLAVDEGRIETASWQSNSILEYGPRVLPADPETDNPLVLDSVSEPEVRHTADFQLTPSGDDAVFSSTLPLTGVESAAHREIFRYHAPSEQLTCVSCNPTGEQASGESTLASDGLSLTDDGRVFFNSTDALVDRDLDERQDVYEWEPEGAGPAKGRCEPASSTFSKASGGCLDLVTPGTSPYDSSLLSASADGTDAFFFTRDALVHGDQNGSRVRIYDAREEGGFPFVPNPVPCKASDECHGAGSPQPEAPNIQSVAPSPGGNESSNSPAEEKCKKGFAKKHGTCVKKPKPHKHHKRKLHNAKHHRGGRR